MDYVRIARVASAAAIAIALTACSQGTSPESTGGSPTGSNPGTNPGSAGGVIRVVTGTITVADPSEWTDLKLALFSDGTDWMSYSSHNVVKGDMRNSRLEYDNDKDPLPDCSLTPVSGASYDIEGTGATERTFSFTLPSDIAPANVGYYLVAWRDGNGNGKLDVKNASAFMTPDVVAKGEFNRVAWKMHLDKDDAAKVEMVAGKFSADSIMKKAGVWLLYLFEDINSYNVYEYLTADNASGFAFNMVPKTTDRVTSW